MNGHDVAFSLAKPLPLSGFPEGKIRLRIRPDEYVLARVKTEDGIREFYVEEKGGFWVPFKEVGRNMTA